MNHIYQLVWNALHQAWVAVSEVASGIGSRSTTDQRRRPGERLERFTIKKVAACAYAISAGALFLINPAQVSAQTLAPTTLPQGGVVTQGAATLQGAGSSSAPVLNVNQTSQRAVINWNTFNLGSAATVNFNQPNTQSATLNRVLDMQPSQIFGRINAPGQVTLVNPAGVYFSPSAVLDVGALTATTLGQTDADFMAGKASFSRNGATGSVVNEGRLTAANYIALLAPEVRNQGTITASAVAMAAGESIQLNFDAFSRLASLSVTPSQIKTLVENRTAVLAPGGLIILSARALSGLQASVVNSGQVDASSLTAQGGRIVLEGDSIQLTTGSSLNASGATGGGTVLVGGDWQGSGSLAQATTVNMAQGASIDASATQSGDGGKVVLWSDVHNANSSTTVNGSISAYGVGAGGQVETSGHTVVMDTAQVQAGGQQRAGLWLIDPYNYTIGAPQAATISASLSGGTSVTVDTSVDVPATGSSGNSADLGNIAVNANIGKTGGVDATLTLKAQGNITMASNAVISATTNKLNVLFNSDLDGNGVGAILLNPGSRITSNGGNITLGGGTAGDGSGFAVGIGGTSVAPGTPGGDYASNAYSPYRNGVGVLGATVDAGGGNITMRGKGGSATSFAVNQSGVVIGLLAASTVSTSGAGVINITGVGGNGIQLSSDVGIVVSSGSTITSGAATNLTGTGGTSANNSNQGILVSQGQIYGGSGLLSLNGTGGTSTGPGNGAAITAIGVAVDRGTVSGGAGGVTVVGQGGSASGSAVNYDGVLVTGSVGTITSTGGDVQVTGTGGSGGAAVKSGVVVTAGGSITNAGSGNVSVTGTAGSGAGPFNVGVDVNGGSITATSGVVAVTGIAGPTAGTTNYGVALRGSGQVATTSGSVVITSDSYSGDGTESVNAGTGTVTIRNRTAGTRINLGGADVLTGSPLTLGLTDAELDRITAGTLVIGRTGATASGDVTLSSSISPALAKNLTVLGGNDIVLNANQTITTLANSNVVLNSDSDGSGAGAIALNAGSRITSNGGNITLGGGLAGDGSGNARGTAANPSGITLTGATVDAGGGQVALRGTGTDFGDGVELGSGSTVTTSGTGTVTLTGTGGAGISDNNDGVYLGSSTVSTASGAISITGVGGLSTGLAQDGVRFDGSTQITTTGGNIAITGTGGGTGDGSSNHDGVYSQGGGTFSAGGAGNLTVIGTGGNATGGDLDGVVLLPGTTLQTASGNLSIMGTGGGSGSGSFGVYLLDNTVQTTAGGNIDVRGVATPGSDFAGGVFVGSPSGVVRTTGGGNIALTGTAGGGTDVFGVGISSGAAVSPSAGTVQILGTLASGALGASYAVQISGNSTVAANGAIGIEGNAQGQSNTYGVSLDSSSISTRNNRPITITTDSYSGDGTEAVSAGTGTVTVQNRTAGTRIDLGGADVLTGSPLTLGLSQTELARITAGTLVLGRNDATAAGAMTVSSAVAPTLATNLTLKTGSTLAVNAPIAVNNTLNLSALGNVSQTVGGNISASNLLLNGPGNYALATASSNAVSALAATGAGVVSYQNSSALQIGSVGGVGGISASGPVTVGTANGDLTVAQNVTTLDASSSAVLLNAGVASAAGTASGGNIVFSGSPAITTGSGGRTTLMTGAVGGSTGVTGFVGAGSGRFRYNSDEVATNYTTPLGSGAYAIYREAPMVNLATGNVGITYGDVLPSFSGTLTGAVNGDVLGASVAVGGAQSSSLNYTAGSHSLTPGSAAATALGYAIGTVTSGTLTVAQKTLTGSFTGINRFYNGSTTAAVGVGGVSSGLVGGDVVSVQNTRANFADKNVGTGKAITVSGVSLSGADALNYAIASTASTSADILAAAITLSSADVSKIYDGTLGAAGAATVASGTLFGGDSLSGGTFAFTDKNVGPGKTVTAAGITVNDGNGGGNYIVSYANNTNSSITPAGLTVTAPTLSKTYDGTTNATGNAIVGTLAGAAAGDQVGLAATLAYTDKNVGLGNKTTRAAGLTVVDSSGTDVTANYAVNYVDNTASSITPAPLTVTANADARFVTLADVPGYNGAHFDGLVGGETPSVLGGTLAVARPNASTDVAAGTYAGALVPSGLSSSNYTITYAPGTYTIVPANQLLVRLANTSTVYGTTPTFNIASVQYLAADGSTILTLSGSQVGNTYTYTDGVGGSVTFTPGPQGAGSSGAGKTPVGNYALADAAPAVGGSNFNGSPVFVGNLAVTQKPVTPTTAGANKIYNGTTDMPGLTLNPTGQEAGDSLVANGSGAFAFRNVGSNLPYVVRDIALAGGDVGNYYLAGGNSLTGSDGSITPAPLTLSTSDVVKTYDATTTALGHAVVTGGTLFGSDSIAGGSFAFTNKNAGLGNKTVTTTGVAVADGNGGNNYTVAYANNTTSTITPASITVATSNVSKPFDGTTSAAGTPVVAGGSLFGTDRLVGGTFAFTDPNVGDNKTVLTSGVGIDDGNGGGNYAITYASNGSSRIVVPTVPTAAVWTQEILLPHPQAVPASPLAPSSSALAVIAGGASAVGQAGATGCMGTSQTGQDCTRRDAQNGYVVVTPVRNVSPVLAGQVLVQVVGLRNGAFEAALPLQASTTLRTQPTPATAALPNGQPLPAWLRFDPQSMVFTAQAVPANAMPLTTLVRSNNYRVEVEISEIR